MATYSTSSNESSSNTDVLVLVYNSVTNTLNDEKRDKTTPFSFLNFLKYSGSNYKDLNELELYSEYLKTWEQKTNISLRSSNSDIRNQFIAFLSEIKLVFLTPEERRFFDNIDLEDNEHLTISVPFFSRKIKEIALYFKKKRDNVPNSLLSTKVKGTAQGVKKFINEEIVNIYTGDDVSDKLTIPENINNFLNNINVNVEQVYDNFNDYFDLDPNKSPTFYNSTSGSRFNFFSSNTNEINLTDYTTTEESIIDILNEQQVGLKEIKGLRVNFNTSDISFIENSRFNNYINTGVASDLNFNNRKLLPERFMGTDVYYVSSNDSTYTYNKLFDAAYPYRNLLNVNYPSAVTIPGNNFKSSREVGLFFKPSKFSILKMETKFLSQLVPEKVLKNSVYLCPDTSRYGNIHGVGGNDKYSPFQFTLLNDSFKNLSSTFGKGLPKITKKNQSFYSYSSVEQRENILNNEIPNQGIAAFSLSGSIYKEQGDIYGNRFLLFDTNAINNRPHLLTEDSEEFNKVQTPLNLFDSQATTINTNFEKEQISVVRRKIKPLYIYNIVKNKVLPIQTELANIFNRYIYNTDLYNEVSSGEFEDVNIFNTTYFFKTSSYLLLENISYDSTGEFAPRSFVSKVKKFNKSVTFDQVKTNLSNFSNPISIGKDIFFIKITSDPKATSSPNIRYMQFEIFKYDNTTNREVNLVTSKTNTESYFAENFTLNLGTNIVQIDSVELSYNSKQNKFMCLTSFQDLNNVQYFHIVVFTIVGNSLKISMNNVIAPDNYYHTENFYSEGTLQTDFLKNITLGISTPTQDKAYGTLRL